MTERVKESYLRFISSELTSHASNIVGFSIILFAYVNITIEIFKPLPLKPEFSLSYHTCIHALRFLLVSVILWLIISIIIFAIMRLIYYGKASYRVITYEISADSLKQLHEKITAKVGKVKIFKVISMGWFEEGISTERNLSTPSQTNQYA